MKKLLLLLLISTISINAQQGLFVFHPVNVDDSKLSEFETIQLKYGKQLAQDNVDNGNFEGWILLKKVRGIGNPTPMTNEIDYIWVHLYKNSKQLAEKSASWPYNKKFGKSRGEIYKGIDVKSPGQFYYKIEKQIQTGNQGKFVLLNWCTPNDISAFMKKADEISERFTLNKMAKYGMTDWGMATRIIPQNKSPLFFWDSYNSMEEVLNHLMFSSIVTEKERAEIAGYIPNGWDNRVIFEILASTYTSN